MRTLRLRLLPLLLPALFSLAPSDLVQAPASFHINPQRLWDTLQKLSEFGRPAGAGFEGGVTRLGFSDEDLAARAWLTAQLREAGLTVRVDPAGNLFARREGTENLPVLLFGSHMDSVPNGGNFDGQVGSMGALEVMRTLQERGVKTRHPLELAIWVNEEGHHFGRAVFGSAAAAGLLGSDVLDRRDSDGLTVADWLCRYGQDPSKFAQARIAKGSLAGYLELHIEQGGILDEKGTPVGVVQGIVGINWWTCTAEGFANHAGTTPMDRRADAFAAAARAVLAVREEVRAEPGRQVGTVGYAKVQPGARNIIPGRVEFPVELRDLDADKVAHIWARIEQRFQKIASEENVQINCVPLSRDVPARTDSSFQQAIRDAARAINLPTLDLPSGAGHDAQNIAHLAPIGMIFVPSRGGISHSPREYSSPEQVANGTEILYRTLLLLDSRPFRKAQLTLDQKEVSLGAVKTPVGESRK